jgi:hypothetical protein
MEKILLRIYITKAVIARRFDEAICTTTPDFSVGNRIRNNRTDCFVVPPRNDSFFLVFDLRLIYRVISSEKIRCLFWGHVLLLILQNSIIAQRDTSDYVFQDAIENAVANNDDLSFDYDTEFEYLKNYIKNPLDINTASKTDFEKLRLLTTEHIDNIIAHREQRKRYITLVELESIVDMITLNRVLPFLTVEETVYQTQVPVNQWFTRGKHDIFLRFGRILEPSKGFKNKETGYIGNANRLYMRYRYAFNKNLQYGFTLERDAGEKKIVDYASFHFKISDVNQIVKTICVGDYSLSLGQGVIHENGFNMGKSAAVLNIEKNANPLKAYTSVNEINFMRGAAAHLKINRNTEGVLFLSSRKRDGNLVIPKDTAYNDLYISSLQNSGFHRTRLEIEDKNAVNHYIVGWRLQNNIRRGSIAFNGIYHHFSKDIIPRDEPYNQYVFKGNQLINSSFDYKYSYQNFHFFGETAASYNPIIKPNFYEKIGYASLNGLLLGLDKKLSISILQRYFSLNYQTINAQPFAESSRIQDEKGVYMGVEYRPYKRLTASLYADMWQHNWWRFRVDAPSYGSEYFGKIAYRLKNTEGYLQVRTKTKIENITRPDSLRINLPTPVSKTQLRIHIQQKVSKKMTLRNRLEYAFYTKENTKSKGFMLYQDVIFEPDKYPLSIASRIAFFDTQDYQSAIYAYENDILYNFTILPNYYRGSRFYINLSYKGMKNCLFECRVARTQLSNRSVIGSGLDEVDGNSRTDIKCQMRVSF